MRTIPKEYWVLAILSGLLQTLIFPSPGVEVLCWVAITPLIIAFLRKVPVAGEYRLLRGREAFLVAYVCGIVWYGGTCYWIYHVMAVYGGLAPPVAVGIVILFCLYVGLYHGLFGFLVSRIANSYGDRRVTVLLTPFLWVAVELARGRITHFPWDLLGTSRVNDIPLTRIAVVTGVSGISFLIVLVNVVFAYAVLLEGRRRRVVLGALLFAVAVLEAGSFYKPPAAVATHSARLVQENVALDEAGRWTNEYFNRTMASLGELSVPGDGRNSEPRLVVWPESPAPFWENDPNFRHWMSVLARNGNAYIIVGNVGVSAKQSGSGRDQLFNSASLVTPRGEFAARYDKVDLVPFGEYVPFKSILVFAEKLTKDVGDFVPGSRRVVFDLGGHKVGVFICYESTFPDEMREFARGGAQLLANISNDGWFGHTAAPGQHLNMVRMRAIENHRWVLRATNTGITASIDPYGRIVTQAAREERLAIDAPYAFESDTTFYTRHGDWFPWSCAIISISALVFGMLRQRQA